MYCSTHMVHFTSCSEQGPRFILVYFTKFTAVFRAECVPVLFWCISNVQRCTKVHEGGQSRVCPRFIGHSRLNGGNWHLCLAPNLLYIVFFLCFSVCFSVFLVYFSVFQCISLHCTIMVKVSLSIKFMVHNIINSLWSHLWERRATSLFQRGTLGPVKWGVRC